MKFNTTGLTKKGEREVLDPNLCEIVALPPRPEGQGFTRKFDEIKKILGGKSWQSKWK